jgi:hypothetical protein
MNPPIDRAESGPEQKGPPRGAKAKRAGPVGVVIFGLLLLIVFVILPAVQRDEQSRQMIRERGLRDIRVLIAPIPGYPGSQLRARTENTDPGPGPYIRLEYDHAQACRDVHTFYASTLPPMGWQSSGFSHIGISIISTYTTKSDGFQFTLTIDCFTNESDYLLEINARSL